MIICLHNSLIVKSTDISADKKSNMAAPIEWYRSKNGDGQ